ncbi:uncharacterized protein BX663DRAFT_507123 [Cokeromyces recurvatus]|uniref:uncharacterized protein n=1 Tax=Cokeromyces recurvatus TaxID=90255 RepID=UPI0022205105|nr:uncharacterized protein BX663DRAFT_507123 [Cokeromyces recurvatus]KAI7903624.1 hypothetical protein BX663DRAFT_507123 [Cokeromyces recurvatus]
MYNNFRELPKPRTRMLATWKIKEMIERGEILMDAPYQRDIVWGKNKMTDLIDSIIHNYYIPPLLFVTRIIKGKQTRIVIDGKQRLTSVFRFMENLLPYVDHSSESPVERYYAEQNTDIEQNTNDQAIPKHFLTEELFNKFTTFEFVCVEYHDISEDDEYEIFSRVQMGVAMTKADKLKAHNTPIAKYCRDIASNYYPISEIFHTKTESYLFQMSAHLLLTLRDDPSAFRGTAPYLEEFICSNWVPTDELKEKMRQVLNVYLGIVHDASLKPCLMKRNNLTVAMKPLEFLAFGKYISLVRRPRDVKSYAADFVNFRGYMFEKWEGKFYLSNKLFLVAMEWVEAYINTHNLVPAIPSNPNLYYDYQNHDVEMDELKMDEYEPENVSIPVQPIVNRRQKRTYGVPVARRGGKLPAGLNRRS